MNEAYKYWMRHATNILNGYRSMNTYNLFRTTRQIIVEKSKGRDQIPSQRAFNRIADLLFLSQLVIFNRVSRKSDILTSQAIPSEKLYFKFSNGNEPPVHKPRTLATAVDASAYYERVSKIFDSFATADGLAEFSETRKMVAIYSCDGRYPSVGVYAEVIGLLHHFERAIEDRVLREESDKLEEERQQSMQERIEALRERTQAALAEMQ